LGRVIATEHLSLDGVMEAPENWAFQYHGSDMTALAREQMESSDALLLGRKTFRLFQAYWPYSNEEPFASHINGVARYCVSTTQQDLSWGDHAQASLICGDVYEEVARLKQQPGKDISLAGSAELMRSLLRRGLIDYLHLYLHPLVLGRGKRLFDSDRNVELELEHSRRLDREIVLNVYRPNVN
jgi:dihydrofolate reductase